MEQCSYKFRNKSNGMVFTVKAKNLEEAGKAVGRLLGLSKEHTIEQLDGNLGIRLVEIKA